MLRDILVPTVLFALIGFIIWLSVMRKSKRDTQQHEEAMAMIEKGIHVPPAVAEPVHRKERYLLTGIILTGLGLAFLLYFAFIIQEKEGLIAAFLFLFPGLGLMGFYRLLVKRESGKEKENRTSGVAPPSEEYT